MRPASLLALAMVMIPAAALAAGMSASDLADLKRGYAAVGLSSSEAPAVRAEQALREPSAGFLLGAALAAWSTAREQLDFDLQHPSAAGAPHASQGEANLDAIDEDCRDEKTAFEKLDGRSRALGLEPAEVLEAAGRRDSAGAQAWRARQAGPVRGCAAPP